MKKLLFLLIIPVILTSSCEIDGCKDSNSYNYNPKATVDDNSCQEMYGCLGYSPNLSNSGSTGITLYDQYYDTKMNEEVFIQKNFYNGINANVYIWYEPSQEQKNALATTDGNILFGYYMFYYTIASYGELPVAGILAHEFGHRVQYTMAWNNYAENSYKELEADAFSGFYMALAKQWAWSQIEGYYSNVYATGDYNFNHPDHHGTPQQRLEAAYYGVQTGLYAINNGIQYTYQEIHNLFINEINNNIGNLKNVTEFKEIEYPKNLKKEYIESLYPRK